MLLALACLVGVAACWRDDLPALATRASAGPESSDAGTVDAPAPTPSGIDAATENVIVIAPGSAADGGSETGEIALSVSLPIDTATGQVAPIGSVTVKLTTADRATARVLTLELGQPRQQVRIDLTEIPAGGPYVLEASATAGSSACATSSTIPFSLLQAETVSVFLALSCAGDGGWSATL